MMLSIRATEDELAYIRGLTPRQRRDKLMSVLIATDAGTDADTSARVGQGTRGFYNVRVELIEEDDRDTLCALSTTERTELLLSGLL